jgi:hypothetical protein
VRPRPWLNLVLYLTLVLGALYLYFPFSSKRGAAAHALVQFVYEQF